MLVLSHAVSLHTTIKDLHYTLLLPFRCDLHCIFDNQNCWNITSSFRSMQHRNDNAIFKIYSKLYFQDFLVWLLNVCWGEKATSGHRLNLQMTLTRLPKNNSSIWTQSYSTTVTVHQCGYYHIFWTKYTLSFLVNSIQNSHLVYGPKVH